MGLKNKDNSTVISINELIENEIAQIANNSNVNINGKYILKVIQIDALLNRLIINLSNNFKAFSEQREAASKHKNCNQLFKQGFTENGQYLIYLNDEVVQVYCDNMEQGGWTRIMNRIEPNAAAGSFNKSIDEYTNGFGDVLGNHWLGLNTIKTMCDHEQMSLRVEFKSKNLDSYFIEYEYFQLGENNYDLNLGRVLNGTIADQMRYQNGSKFTAYDMDSDLETGNCATVYRMPLFYL